MPTVPTETSIPLLGMSMDPEEVGGVGGGQLRSCAQITYAAGAASTDEAHPGARGSFVKVSTKENNHEMEGLKSR